MHGTEVYRSGKYHLLSADSTIFMVVNDDVKKLHLSFETNSNNRRVMHLKNNRTGEEKRLFENAYPLKDYKEDPFYSANNEWRTKPALPQSKVQIQAKLADYVKHNCLILKAADDRNQRVISWEFSKGIIRFYNGGIGIVSPEYIPQSWIDTFHSRDEAMEAFAMFDAALRSNKYKGRKTANWLKDDYAILNATYHILKGNRELHQAVQ